MVGNKLWSKHVPSAGNLHDKNELWLRSNFVSDERALKDVIMLSLNPLPRRFKVFSFLNMEPLSEPIFEN